MGRWLRCCWRRCELMGRKNPWAASGTCVLLVAVVGRLAPRLPATLMPAPRRGAVGCDHRPWLPECAVATDDGREGGSDGSPTGPVMPSTRLPVELRFCSDGVMAMVSLLLPALSLSLHAA